MRSTHLTCASFLAGLALSSCVTAVQGGDGAPAPQTPTPSSEIMRLRTRHGDVAFLAGSGGRRVTIYGEGGVVLVRSADVETLRTSDPALYEILTTATARRTYLDATLDVPRETQVTATPADGLR